MFSVLSYGLNSPGSSTDQGIVGRSPPRYTAVLRKVVLQMGKSLCNNVESFMGTVSGGFYSCLSEPQGVTTKWNEMAQARAFVLPPPLLLNHLKPLSSKA